MEVLESAEAIGLRAIDDFDDAWRVWPRGDRLEALRAAAHGFRARFSARGQVTGVRAFELAAVPYPGEVRLRHGRAGDQPLHLPPRPGDPGAVP